MPFEVFDKRRNSRSRALTVTIQRRGIFSISEAAYHELGEPAHVELLFDRDEQLVGLRPVSDAVAHAYAVRRQSGKSGGPAIVAGQAFTQYFEIDTSESRRRDAKVEDGMLVVDLKDEGSVIVGNRSRSHDDADATESDE